MAAKRSSDIEVVVLNVKETIAALRWHEDMVITNDEDERVWLRPLVINGKRIGIEDCCLEDEPCDWHRQCAAPARSPEEA